MTAMKILGDLLEGNDGKVLFKLQLELLMMIQLE